MQQHMPQSRPATTPTPFPAQPRAKGPQIPLRRTIGTRRIGGRVGVAAGLQALLQRLHRPVHERGRGVPSEEGPLITNGPATESDNGEGTRAGTTRVPQGDCTS